MGIFYEEDRQETRWSRVIGTIAFVLFLLICLGMYGFPQYNVWQQGLAGEAELKRAEQNRQITIEEAIAENTAAESKAETRIKIATADAKAEIIQAGGVAKANEIIGKSLRDNESYLRYLWIKGLHDGSSEVIYIPTEANLPILEATRKMQRNRR